MKYIILTGPESSGKTTLAEYLASYFKVPLVTEFARKYLEENGSEYKYADVRKMLEGQEVLEQEAILEKPELIICDTDILTYKIWYQYKYGETLRAVERKLKEVKNRFYLLCSPDIQWVEDPYREHPNERWSLFDLYKDTLEFHQLPYHIIDGSYNHRKEEATKRVLDFIR